MFSRKRSVQARRQARDDQGQFKRADSGGSDSGGGGDSGDSRGAGARPPVKTCGHRYCIYCISTSSDSDHMTEWHEGPRDSSSESSAGGGLQIRSQSPPPPRPIRLPLAPPSPGSSGRQERSGPRRRQSRRGYSSSATSSDGVGVDLIDLSSASVKDAPATPAVPSSSLRTAASVANTKKKPVEGKGKEKAKDQGTLHSVRNLHHQVAQSDARISILVGQLELEKANNKELQRALLEANKNAWKK